MIPESEAKNERLSFQSPPDSIEAVCKYCHLTTDWKYQFSFNLRGEEAEHYEDDIVEQWYCKKYGWWMNV